MIHLVLKQDPRRMVAHKRRRMVLVISLHQKIRLDASPRNRQHQLAEPVELRVAHSTGPEAHGVVEVDVLGCRLLVLAVERYEDALGPGVAHEPVKGAEDREVRVRGGWVCHVPEQSMHERVDCRRGPLGVQMADDGSCMDEIAVVVMMIAK